MRTKFAPVLAAGLIALAAGTAAAQIDVGLAFNPKTASPGQCVTFFRSIANLGTEPITARLELTVNVGGCNFGPICVTRCLAAGQECSSECSFTIPCFIPAGTLTLTLRGTAGTSTDTAVASLTVLCNSTAAPTQDQLQAIGDELLDGMGGAPLASGVNTFGAIKHLYR